MQKRDAGTSTPEAATIIANAQRWLILLYQPYQGHTEKGELVS